MKTVASWLPNLSGNPLEKNFLEHGKRYSVDGDFLPIKDAIEMWAKAIDKAGLADPVKVAKALEDKSYGAGVGEAWTRADDHQFMAPLRTATFGKVGKRRVKYDADDTGHGWRVDTRAEAKDSILRTTGREE